MVALVLVCPPLALLTRLSQFRRAVPEMQRYQRNRICVAACGMGVVWALVAIMAIVVATTGKRGGGA
jgi:hypothetical protein